MSLSVPIYPNQYSTTPLENAYVWINAINLDLVRRTGSLGVFVNVDAASASAGLDPIDAFGVTLGEVQTDGTTFPTLTDILTSAATAAVADGTLSPFDAIRKAIYTALLLHPKLTGGTEVE